MDPQGQFCHNPACPARGQVGHGNIGGHSQGKQRYVCHRCGRTFAATTGTAFYRLRTVAETVTVVLTLLSRGCPVQAVVAAFGVDERTVARWLPQAGSHCQQVHQQLVQQGQVDLQHVQADELWVKLVGQRVWIALARAIPSRQWLGGRISPLRDLVLITGLVQQVRACARCLALLVCVDGLASYVTAFGRGFRTPVYTGWRGRPRLVLVAGFLLGQVVKQDAKWRAVRLQQRVRYGTAGAIAAVLAAPDTGHGIHTAYIGRFNVTLRSALAPLVQWGRALARKVDTLTAGMYPVGCACNFCWPPGSLRVLAPAGHGWKWQERPPATAAGLTAHPWTMHELLRYQVPLPAWVPPKRRGRPPNTAPPPPLAVAS